MTSTLTSSISEFDSKFGSKDRKGRTFEKSEGSTIVKAKYFAIRCPKLPDGDLPKEYWKKFPDMLKRFSGETTLKIENNIYDKGAFSVAFRAVDIGRK
jgi:hypothetical protein